MAPSYLIDTDVLIDYLRGDHRAARFLEDLKGDLFVSSITVAELYSGVRNVEEERALDEFLLAFQVVEVDQQIAKSGGPYRHQFSKSHGTGLADALIAASAEARHAILVSLNRRHFPMAKGMKVPYT
jgi:predicted nucleic acid-binding protein